MNYSETLSVCYNYCCILAMVFVAVALILH